MKKKQAYRSISPVHYNENDVLRITKNYSSFMNNKKWYKLFDFFYENEFFDPIYTEIKLVWEDKERRLNMPRGLDYYAHGIEGIVWHLHRWCYYPEIEYIKFPKEFFKGQMSKISHEREVYVDTQSLAKIEAILKTIKFALSIQVDDDSIVIHGYKKK